MVETIDKAPEQIIKPRQVEKQYLSHITPTPRQRALINSPADTIFFGGARGGGKAQPYDAKVFTPFGFRLMGDLKIGDTISGRDGMPQRVIGVYDQGEQDIYEIQFIDGAKTQCTLDHLWNVKKTCPPSKKHKDTAAHEFDWNVWTFGQIKKWLDEKLLLEKSRISVKDRLLIPCMTNGDGNDETTRPITGYRYVGRKQARCIAVSNPDSLYITDDFIVTHNTYGIGVMIFHRVITYGKPFRAIFFRRTNPELEDAIDQFTELFGVHATWIASKNAFEFWNGAYLKMGYIDDIRDSKKYQGKQYSFMAFDEVTNFDDFNIIERMRGSLRSAHGIPTQLVMSGNPGGPLHVRLKMDFIDPYPRGEVLIPDGYSKTLGRMLTRSFIPSKLDDNPYLKDTEYRDNLMKSGTPEQVRQWLDGDWNVTQNSAFADIFDHDTHVIRPFMVPKTWKVIKSYDYGSSRPWGCVWFAVSDGSDFLQNGFWRPTIPGDIFAIYELYGWNGRPNEGNKESIQSQAEKIKQVEELAMPGYEVTQSIADSAIFTSMSGAYCISDDFADNGVFWERCNKYPGSRQQGYVLMRERLLASIERDGKPGIFWFSRCQHSIRTIPLMQMDKDGSDRVATGSGSEDHLYDLTAYLLLAQDCGEVESGASFNY